MSHHGFLLLACTLPSFTHTSQAEEAAEVAGLDEEAELPLEQLLARYGGYRPGAAGGSDDDMPGGSGGAHVGRGMLAWLTVNAREREACRAPDGQMMLFSAREIEPRQAAAWL